VQFLLPPAVSVMRHSCKQLGWYKAKQPVAALHHGMSMCALTCQCMVRDAVSMMSEYDVLLVLPSCAGHPKHRDVYVCVCRRSCSKTRRA
jgi:hypothetical protein